MGQIDEVFFGSFFGHNNKIKSYNKENSYFDFDFERFINETGIKVGGNE